MAKGEVWKRWAARNKDRLQANARKRREKRGPTPPIHKWRIIALSEPNDPAQVRWVECAHANREAPWRVIWRYRDKITSPLSDWLCTLSREPTERSVLGSVVGLGDTQAVALCRALVERLGADLNRLNWRWGRPGRPVVKIDGEALTFYISERAAGRANGIAQVGVWLALALGKGYYDGSPRSGVVSTFPAARNRARREAGPQLGAADSHQWVV